MIKINKINGGIIITAEKFEENDKILKYIDDNLKFNQKCSQTLKQQIIWKSLGRK